MILKEITEYLNETDIAITDFRFLGIQRGSDLNDILDVFDDDEYKVRKIFAERSDIKIPSEFEDEDELQDWIANNNLTGVFMTVEIPVCSDFDFENGSPKRWSASRGHCYMKYIYTEDMSSIIDKIKEFKTELFDYDVKKAKKQQGSKEKGGE